MTIRITNLLKLLFILEIFPIMAYAQETKPTQNFVIYTPYTQIAVPPGEVIDYSIDVINNDDEVKNALLSVSGIPLRITGKTLCSGINISDSK